MNNTIDVMTNYELETRITTQLGTKSIRDTIHKLGYSPVDFTDFTKSMLIAYANSLVINLTET